MYGPYPYYPPPPAPREVTLKDIREQLEVYKAWEKELEDKGRAHANKAREKKGASFSFLETFSLIMVASFIAGPFVGYLYLTFLIEFIHKYAVIAPLIQK